MTVTNLTETLGYETDQFVFSESNAYPGSRQDQSVTGDGVTRTEYTQAAATDSDGAGGDFAVVLGAKDGIGGLSSFSVARELTPGGTRFNAFTVTPGATDTAATTVSAIGGFSFDSALTLASLAVSNKAAGGSIGAASATVDLYNVFVIHQTTAAQTLTLPTPTDTSTGRLAIVINDGTASFTMGGGTVAPGGLVTAVYENEAGSGSPAWRFQASGSGGGSSSGAAGSVQLSGGSGAFASDGTRLFWNTTTHRLGVQTNAPTADISFGATSTINSLAGDITLQASDAFHVIGSTDSSIIVTGAPEDGKVLALDSSSEIDIGVTNAVTIQIGNTDSSLFIAGGFSFQGSSFSFQGGGGSFSASGTISVIPSTNLYLGNANTTNIGLGRSGIPVSINGAITIVGSAASSMTTSVGALTFTSAAALNLGTATSTSVAIGRSGITTTVTGGLTQLTGAVSLSGNAASSFVTTVGALTLNGASNATLAALAGTLNLTASTRVAFACADVRLPGLNVVVSTALNYDGATGAIGPVTSSRRFKENIKPLKTDSALIFALEPMTYTRKDVNNGAEEFGFIAEDVVKVLPEVVPLDAEGLPFSVNYDKLVVLLLQELRALKARVDAFSGS